ncbi:MAG: glutaredoxin domain-containing protein [Pseudomonadota bacterium]
MKSSRRSLFSLVLLVLVVSAGVQWWHGAREARLGETLAARVGPGDIHLLTSDTCDICTFARHWLRQHRVPFTECSIERDAQCARDYQATRSPGTPVVLVRGKPQVGFDPERLLAALG